jgi:hypothetical protein
MGKLVRREGASAARLAILGAVLVVAGWALGGLVVGLMTWGYWVAPLLLFAPSCGLSLWLSYRKREAGDAPG